MGRDGLREGAGRRTHTPRRKPRPTSPERCSGPGRPWATAGSAPHPCPSPPIPQPVKVMEVLPRFSFRFAFPSPSFPPSRSRRRRRARPQPPGAPQVAAGAEGNGSWGRRRLTDQGSPAAPGTRTRTHPPRCPAPLRQGLCPPFFFGGGGSFRATSNKSPEPTAVREVRHDRTFLRDPRAHTEPRRPRSRPARRTELSSPPG